MSKLWRASFEFELKPHAIFENGVSSSTYFPPQFGVSNSGVGPNTIDSIFHFGNNDQQVCIFIHLEKRSSSRSNH